jgi:hypothetical protein
VFVGDRSKGNIEAILVSKCHALALQVLGGKDSWFVDERRLINDIQPEIPVLQLRQADVELRELQQPPVDKASLRGNAVRLN